jgi:hypothetical protein
MIIALAVVIIREDRCRRADCTSTAVLKHVVTPDKVVRHEEWATRVAKRWSLAVASAYVGTAPDDEWIRDAQLAYHNPELCTAALRKMVQRPELELEYQGLDLRGQGLLDPTPSFRGADLRFAKLSGADLSGVDLSGADLTGADLRNACLRNANLTYTRLKFAQLKGADLDGALLSPIGLPFLSDIAWARNLRHVRCADAPAQLSLLSGDLADQGYSQPARELTAARHAGWLELNPGPLRLYAFLQFILFGITCDYGAQPARPLLWVLLVSASVAGVHFFWPVDYELSPGSRALTGLRNAGAGAIRGISDFLHTSYGLGIFGRHQPEAAPRVTWRDHLARAQGLVCCYLFILAVLSYVGRPFGGW